VQAEAQKPFDLERGPLWRVRLLQLAPEEHWLQMTLHHIVTDGWSTSVLARDMSLLYAMHRDGCPSPLPALPVQYADYAVWQRDWVSGPRLQAQAAYWQATLAGAPPELALPTDRPRPAQPDYGGDAVPVVLDASLTTALKALGQRHGTTLFMTLLAAWSALLGRLAGQTEVVIGTPIANRDRAEIKDLIGFFVNTLALRLDRAGTPTVASWLGRVKAQTLAAQAHQDLPFEQVVERLQPQRRLAQHPLFQVVFA